MSVFYIYVLADPRLPSEIRYVGRAKDPINRLATHISPSKLLDKTHKNDWIKKLLSEGFIPEIRCIEKCTDLKRETYWIRYFKSLGFDLTNANDGGDGQLSPSPETIEKISRKLKGRIFGDRLTEQGRKNISAKNKGRIKSLKERENISKSQRGKVLKEETKSKIKSARLKQIDPRRGKTHSEETKKLLSEKMTGSGHPQYGIKRDEDTKNKISRTKKQRMSPDWNKIKNVFNKFHDMGDIMKELGISRATFFNYKRMIK